MGARDKLAVIVIGPESSGTKFLTKLFIKAGCFGDSWHKQRLDNSVPNQKKVVLRRSYPHGSQWPDLKKQVVRFRSLGYEVKVVVVIRSMQFSAASRKRKGSLNMENMRRSLKLIGSQLEQADVDFVWITYEALLLYKQRAVEWVFNWAGLPVPALIGKVALKDGNRKYVEGGK